MQRLCEGVVLHRQGQGETRTVLFQGDERPLDRAGDTQQNKVDKLAICALSINL